MEDNLEKYRHASDDADGGQGHEHHGYESTLVHLFLL